MGDDAPHGVLGARDSQLVGLSDVDADFKDCRISLPELESVHGCLFFGERAQIAGGRPDARVYRF